MNNIDELNKMEDEKFPEKEYSPENISEEELENYANRLSQKINSCEDVKKKRTIKKAVKTITTDYLPRLKKYNKSLKIIGNSRYIEADFRKSPNTSGTIKQHDFNNSRTP